MSLDRRPGHCGHTDEALTELGYSPTDTDTLRVAGALGDANRGVRRRLGRAAVRQLTRGWWDV